MANNSFGDLSLDQLPQCTYLRDLLNSIESQLGKEVRQHIEDTLQDRDDFEVINVRDLLSDIQDELGSSCFQSLLEEEDEDGKTQEWRSAIASHEFGRADTEFSLKNSSVEILEHGKTRTCSHWWEAWDKLHK